MAQGESQKWGKSSKTVRLVAKPKSGYVFAGWYCGASPLNEGASPSGKIDGIPVSASSILRFGDCNGHEQADPYALFYLYVKSQDKSMRVLVEFPLDDDGCQSGKAWFDY